MAALGCEGKLGSSASHWSDPEIVVLYWSGLISCGQQYYLLVVLKKVLKGASEIFGDPAFLDSSVATDQ